MGMTLKEKKRREEVRKDLRAKGLLPPIKKRLDRKKFCDEAGELLGDMNFMDDWPYIVWALNEMLAYTGGGTGKRSPEAVGAAKAIKLAAARSSFEKACREDGKKSYSLGELYEAVKEIFEA